jgi:hypothetical protein
VILVAYSKFLILTSCYKSVRSSLHFVSKVASRFDLRYAFNLCIKCLKWLSNQRVAALVELCPSNARDEGSNLVPAYLFCGFKSCLVSSLVKWYVTRIGNTNHSWLEWLVHETVNEPTRVRTSLVSFLIPILFTIHLPFHLIFIVSRILIECMNGVNG